MCRPVNCKVCGKNTWAGCGQHVDQVIGSVPPSQRCTGHSDAEKAAARGGSILGRLFGRS
jgi:hypothetical protein